MRVIARRLVVHGRVQGVFYCGWAVETARALGVAGWVRNLSSGAVEILASGAPEAVDTLIERCRSGPPAASVARIDVEEAEAEPLATFEKRPTL